MFWVAPFIDFHANNTQEDYSSRIIDTGDYLLISSNKEIVFSTDKRLTTVEELYRYTTTFDNTNITTLSGTNKYYDFTPPATGEYMLIVAFRPLVSTANCLAKIGSIEQDAIGGTLQVPQYNFSSFSCTFHADMGVIKRIIFETTDSNPTIRCTLSRL